MRNKKSLGYPQQIALNQFTDCVKKTRKKVDLTGTQELVRFMLEESSVTHDRSDDGRSFYETSNAIRLINKKLCPGEWCTRAHCDNYSSSSAYNCDKTRPSVCKIYKKYVEGQEKRNNK